MYNMISSEHAVCIFTSTALNYHFNNHQSKLVTHKIKYITSVWRTIFTKCVIKQTFTFADKIPAD